MNLVTFDGRTRSVVRHIGETLQINELINKSRVMVRGINETLNKSETINRLKSIFRYGNDTFNVSENISKVKTIIRSVLDTLNLREPISAFQHSLFQNDVFQIELNRGIIRALGFVKVLDESLQISESIGIKFSVIIIVSYLASIHKTTGSIPQVSAKYL